MGHLRSGPSAKGMPDSFSAPESRRRRSGAGERVLISPRVHRSWEKHFPYRMGTAMGVQPSPMELEGTTVLVVEDDEDTREVIRAMLELCGARGLVAGAAKRGLEAVERGRPDADGRGLAVPGGGGRSLGREGAARRDGRGGA